MKTQSSHTCLLSYVAAILFFGISVSHAVPRTWTNSGGVKITGELVSIKKENAEILVRGKTFEVPVSSLSKSDQDFIQDWKMESAQKAAEAEIMASSSIIKALKGNLVKLDGRKIKEYEVEFPEKLEFIAFYNSASWCGPCHAFTPSLVRKYKSLKKKYSNFEVVLLSADRNEPDWEEYLKEYKMPWPALNFSASDAKSILRAGSTSRFIPAIHILKVDGEVVDDASGGAKAALKHLEELLKESAQ